MERWSISTSEKISDRFTSTDIIESLATEPYLLTVIRRDDQRWIADLETGTLLHRLPSGDKTQQRCFAAGPGRVVYAVNADLICFDYLKQETAWKLEKFGTAWTWSERYAVVMHTTMGRVGRRASNTQKPFIIKLATGEPISGIERFHSCEFDRFSPDGRLAMLRDRKRVRVLDIEREFVVWQTDPKVGEPPPNLTFSPDSQELLQHALSPSGRLQTGRIRIADGRILASLPHLVGSLSNRGLPRVLFTSDQRFAYAERRSAFEAQWRNLRNGVSNAAKWLGLTYAVPPITTETVLIDATAGETIGPFVKSQFGMNSPSFSPTGAGFVLVQTEAVKAVGSSNKTSFAHRLKGWRLYHLPPTRNWPLLVAVSAFPWAVIGLTRLAWNRRSRKRQSANRIQSDSSLSVVSATLQ